MRNLLWGSSGIFWKNLSGVNPEGILGDSLEAFLRTYLGAFLGGMFLWNHGGTWGNSL